MTDSRQEVALGELFPGDGEMARRCRDLDWSAAPLGPPEDWPAALRTVVRMAIECPFPINLWCGDELTLVYNDGYRSVLGAKHPAALGKPGMQVWQEIWNDIAPMFAQIRAGGPAVYAEDSRFIMERTDGPGDHAWFTFGLSPVREETGDIVAFINPATETTQRVRAEAGARTARAAAERAERQLREVFAQAPAFLAVLTGPEHVFEFVNEAYMRLVGDRKLIGRRLIDALPEVAGQVFIPILDRVLETGIPHVGREVPLMLRPSEHEPPVQAFVDFVYQPISDENGRRSGIVAQGTVVTETVLARHEIERLWHESESTKAAALESESRYRFLANAIPVQVWTASPDGALEYVSDRTAAYFGKPTEQVIGEQWLSVLHPEDVERTTARWIQSLQTGEPYEVEFRLWSAEHRDFRWHLGRATPQRDANGTIIRWFGTNTEIQEWKQAEAELKRLTHEATEANRAKSDFLAAMSHELRTPLNAIVGYAQLIEIGVRGPVTEEQRVDLLKIQRSKNHLDSLVAEVLSFAKLGAGSIDFRVRDVGVSKLVESVVELIAPQLQQKELTLAPLETPADACVAVDEDKTRQILVNLFANALKFTPAGGKLALSVSCEPKRVAISVSDTGIGIPEDQLERIFEPFVQAKRALNASDNGVGLGLAISRQLARAMQGDLTVRSTLGVGSTFTLTLPRAQ